MNVPHTQSEPQIFEKFDEKVGDFKNVFLPLLYIVLSIFHTMWFSPRASLQERLFCKVELVVGVVETSGDFA